MNDNAIYSAVGEILKEQSELTEKQIASVKAEIYSHIKALDLKDGEQGPQGEVGQQGEPGPPGQSWSSRRNRSSRRERSGR